MAKEKKLSEIKSALQKIAQDIETPEESAAAEVAGPEEVMELVEDAIEVLEVAEEAIPAEKEEDREVGAKTRKAQDDPDKKDRDREREADDEKDAKQRKAQEDEDEEDEELKEAKSKIAALEEKLLKQDKEKLAEQFAELVPDNLKQAKFDEIVNSDASLEQLERDYKIAKEALDWGKPTNSYKPAKNESGYLMKKASQSKAALPPWKV